MLETQTQGHTLMSPLPVVQVQPHLCLLFLPLAQDFLCAKLEPQGAKALQL